MNLSKSVGKEQDSQRKNRPIGECKTPGITKQETDQTVPNTENLIKLAKIFGILIDY